MLRCKRFIAASMLATLVGANPVFAASSNLYGLPTQGTVTGGLFTYCPAISGPTTGTDQKCTFTVIDAFINGQFSGDATVGGTGVVTVGKIGGKAVTLSAALTTTGAGAPTLAFPGTSQTYTFPAVTDTLVTLTATQTLTNKSIAASEINSGQIALANGGTNANITAAAGAVAYSSASALALTAAGSTGQCLTSNGTSAPSWGACGTGSAVTTTIGTGATLSGNSQIYVCQTSSPCAIVLPTPAAGVQYCVMNDTTVVSAIRVTPPGGVQLTNTSYTYNSAGAALTSTGAAGDQMCFLGRDTTHYLLGSYTGSWS